MNPTETRRINLTDWMRGDKKLILQHGTRPYFLTITRRGKLILTAADEAEQAETADEKTALPDRVQATLPDTH